MAHTEIQTDSAAAETVFCQRGGVWLMADILVDLLPRLLGESSPEGSSEPFLAGAMKESQAPLVESALVL